MGEEKFETDARRKTHLNSNYENDSCNSDVPAKWEAAIAYELDGATPLTVRRWPAMLFALKPMVPLRSHENCFAFAAEDPAVDLVTGWWKQSKGVYLLHSVVRLNGHYACITPQSSSPNKRTESIEFIPDSKLAWHFSGGTLICKRDCQPIGNIVRSAQEIKKVKTFAAGT